MGDDQVSRRNVVTSAAGLSALLALLGIEKYAAAGLALARVEVLDEQVRLFLSWGPLGDFVVCLAPADGRPCFCTTAAISVMLVESAVTRPLSLLMRRIAAGLRDRTVPALETALEPHFEIIRSSQGPGGGDSTGDVEGEGGGGPDTPFLPSPINTWSGDVPAADAATTYPRPARDFLCDHAMQRKFYESFQFDGRSACVVHGDLECSFITPRGRTPLPRFFNYPWPLPGAQENRRDITDMDDLDVINGGTEKLDEYVRRAVARVGKEGPVTINSTCIPTLIGDDIERVIARNLPDAAHGVFLISPRTLSPVDVFMKYVEKARDKGLAEGIAPVPGAVALVGFREDAARDELIGLLDACGIPLSGCILPLEGEKLMRDVLTADVLVFRPSEIHQALYGRLFTGVERTRIAPPAPWGWKSTEAWLLTVADAAGRGEAAREVLAARMAEGEARRAGLRTEAQRHTLAFVLDAGQEGRVLDRDAQTGLPVLGVVRDLGFPVRVLVFAGRPAAWETARARLAAEAGDGVEVVPFTTPEELQAGLPNPPVRAVFTEYFYDVRLSRTGKGQFSSRDFEMGLAGADRTLDRLVRVARTPFYREYAAHLAGGPAAGWRE